MEHPLTLKQYNAKIYAELREITGADKADCLECIPAHEANWKRGATDYAENGGKFRAAWLNTIDPTWGRWLASLGDCIPAGYVWPDCRDNHDHFAPLVYTASGEWCG